MRNRSFALAAARIAVTSFAGFAVLAGPPRAHAQSTVLLSELCDPSLNYLTDRFLEIANVGVNPVDLTGWSLVAVGNGTDIFTWNLSGTIAPGDALVAGDATTVDPFPVDFPDEAWSSNNSTWNGKVGDGAKLYGPGAVLVDIIVATGTTFENEDLTRNPDVLAPSSTYTPAEWTGTPVSLPSQGTPGTHTTLPPPQGPIVTNPVTDPAVPTASDAVHVFADVVDTVGTLTSVSLFWGTDPDSIDTEIPMSQQGGDTYRTDTPIPATAQGATIHYEVHAANDVPASTVLGFLGYDVPWEVPIATIQGMAAASPYDGEAVLTGGVVTAAFGSYFVLQDGAGGWTGIWARSAASVLPGDSLEVYGHVTEGDPLGFAGNTLIADATVVSSAPGAPLPAAVDITSVGIASEEYEGVLVRVLGAQCIDANAGLGEWEIDDGSGTGRVGDLVDPFDPVLGTVYDVTGCGGYAAGLAKLEPRTAADVTWVSDAFAPLLLSAGAPDDTTVSVLFSEEVDPATSETAGNYGVSGVTVLAAARDAVFPARVELTVTAMAAATYTLTVNGVEDLYGNALTGGSVDFPFAPPPPGYYDPAEGKTGAALRAALHAIIDDHTVVPYADTWVSFATTDDKPNGTVWDMYSDVPGGTPPYEYQFFVDQGGAGGQEGTGYNREHSWPQSWFGGDVPPMNSDLFQLYPTDNWVNNQRGSFPYGEVDSPNWTSLNGCKLGPCAYPGYSGTAFEPIDAYKGDFARSYFYMTTRYYLEDGAWPTTDMTDGADLLPWAVDMLLEWNAQDPVSQKEIDRNGAVYDLQGNRNPFIDRPEFGVLLLSPAVGVGPVAGAGEGAMRFELGQNAPNPFGSATAIRFALPARGTAILAVYDVTGRLVARLVEGEVDGGRHEVRWDGRNRAGKAAAPGVYFYRLEAGERQEVRRMVRLR